MSNPYEKLLQRLEKSASTGKKRELEKWRRYYRKAGPVEFAEKELACPVGVPPHPVLGRLKNVLLSEGQKEFLTDLFNGQKLSIVSAARGSGKTFAIAIYTTWKLACFDFFEATIMGGAAKQSEIIQNYINFWRVQNPKLKYIINKSVISNINPHVATRYGSIARFTACSPTAARGPHVQLIVIDEVVAAEEKGKDGVEAVKSVWWQMVGKADGQLVMLSTAQSISGSFYEYYTGPMGADFKKYMWGIAKHKSGITDPYLVYKDTNPDNWEPAVWWVTEEDVRTLRKAKSNDEYLCEALGGFSQVGGLIFARDDLSAAICDRKECKTCEPYTDKCMLMKEYKLGSNLKHVTERSAGIDWGDRSPNAIVVLGRKDEKIFVLYSEELITAMVEEKLRWAKEILEKYKVEMVYPDPEDRSMAQLLQNAGDWTIALIWELLSSNAKEELMLNAKRIFERHQIIIPRKYDSLIRCLRQMSIDEQGKIKKRRDHSYDALTYALHDFNELESLSEFWSVSGREIGGLW